MATEQTAITKAELDASIEVTHGYIDTAVGTLTAEMDRQFKEVRGDIAKLDKRFDEVIQSIKSLETFFKEHSHA